MQTNLASTQGFCIPNIEITNFLCYHKDVQNHKTILKGSDSFGQ